MDLEILTQVIELVKKCPVCGDATIGNGSRFDVDCDQFERTCRCCGWKTKGKVEAGRIVVTEDNREQLVCK